MLGQKAPPLFYGLTPVPLTRFRLDSLTHGAVAVTVVVVNVAQVFPLVSMVSCAALSCPLWHAPAAETSCPLA